MRTRWTDRAVNPDSLASSVELTALISVLIFSSMSFGLMSGMLPTK